jgi:type I restriction enzyme S subunit
MSKQTTAKVPQIRFKAFEGGWSNTTFQTACSLLTGHPFQSKQFTKSGFFLVRGMNVKRGYIDDSAQITEFWPSSSGLEAFLLKEDDIVIQMDGALIGRSYAKVRKENLPALLVQRVTRARCESAANSEYIYQYIERDFLKYIRATKTETAVPHLSLNDIRQFPISISTPPEQNQIGKYFRELDRLIGLHQRKHDKLATLKKAMLQKMFPQPGATTPEIRFKGFSGDWKEKKLGDLIDLGSGRDYKHLSPGDIPVYGTGGYMLSVNEALSASMDAVGIGRKGTIDKPYILRAPFWTVDTLFYAIPKAENFLDFVYCIFQRIDWKQKDESTGVPSLSKVAINGVSVLSTNPSEQQKIGSYFRTLDELISKHATQLQKLQQIKSACLEKMFV